VLLLLLLLPVLYPSLPSSSIPASQMAAASILRRHVFVTSWLLLGGLAWLVPLLIFAYSRRTHTLPADYYNASGANNNNAAADDDVGWSTYFAAQDDDDDVQWQNYRANNCSWLFGCAYRNHSPAQPPRWWICLSDGSNDYVDSAALQAALALVYVGSSVLFGGILYFGCHMATLVRYDQVQRMEALVPVLCVSCLYTLLIMVLMTHVGGLVDLEGEEFLSHGFYGQCSVLLFVTSFFWMVVSLLFGGLLQAKARCCFYPSDSIDNYQLHDAAVVSTRQPPPRSRKNHSRAARSFAVPSPRRAHMPTSSVTAKKQGASPSFLARTAPLVPASRPPPTLPTQVPPAAAPVAATSPPIVVMDPTTKRAPSDLTEDSISTRPRVPKQPIKSLHQRRWEASHNSLVKSQTLALAKDDSETMV
jgi:hypothetical protein